MDDAQIIRIGDILYAIKKRWKMIVALGLAGGALAVVLSGVSYLQGGYTNYLIYTSFYIATQSADDIYVGNYGYTAQTDFHLAEDMVDAVSYVMRSDAVLSNAIVNAGVATATTSDLSDNLSVSQYNDTQIVEVTLTWDDVDEATQLMSALVDATRDMMQQTFMFGTIRTIDEPTAYHYRTGGLDSQTLMLVVLLGPVIGVAIAVLEVIMRPTLLTLKTVKTVLGMETLGVIPQEDAYFQEGNLLLESRDESSPVEQDFASSAYILCNRFATKEPHHCFYVTSAQEGEGKTTIAANLAVQLADMERHVLLIDLDTRNPSLGGLFLKTVDYDRTLNSLYKGEATVDEAITPLTGYLDFLPTVLERNPVPLDSTLFDFIRGVQEKYDYIVIDAPAVGESSDVLSLNQVAEAALFVIRYDDAPMHDIEEAIDTLDKSGIRLLGCIVNASQVAQRRSFWKDWSSDIGSRISKRRQPASPAMSDNAAVETPEENDLLKVKAVKSDDGDGWKLTTATAAESAEPRSVLDELTDDYSGRDTLSDTEALDALLQMGADGSWKKHAAQPVETPAAPAVPSATKPEAPAAEVKTVIEQKEPVFAAEPAVAPEAVLPAAEPVAEPETPAFDTLSAAEPAAPALDALSVAEPKEPAFAALSNRDTEASALTFAAERKNAVPAAKETTSAQPEAPAPAAPVSQPETTAETRQPVAGGSRSKKRSLFGFGGKAKPKH